MWNGFCLLPLQNEDRKQSRSESHRRRSNHDPPGNSIWVKLTRNDLSRKAMSYQGNPVRSWYESSNEITCRVNKSWLAAVAPIISCPKSNPLPRSVGLENSRDWKRPSAIDGAETWWGEREEEQEWRERLRWESKTLRYAISSDGMWLVSQSLVRLRLFQVCCDCCCWN